MLYSMLFLLLTVWCAASAGSFLIHRDYEYALGFGAITLIMVYWTLVAVETGL